MIRPRIPLKVCAGIAAFLLLGSAAVVAAYPSQRLLGAMFEADRNLNQALLFYRSWVEDNPRDFEARWHVASLELAVARPGQAQRTLEAMAADWPNNRDVLEKLVEIEDSLLHVRGVIPRLDAIAARYPDDVATLRRLADHQRWFGNSDALLAALERLAVHEQAFEERVELADILLANRDYDRLIEFFAQNPVASPAPEDDTRLFVAEAQKRSNRPEQASETLLAVLADRPTHGDALEELARLWSDRDRPDIGESYIARATAVDPQRRRAVTAGLYATASERARARGQRQRAVVLARRRVAIEPDSVNARLALADLFGDQADAMAVIELQELSERRPEDPSVRRLLGERLSWLNRPHEALEAFDAAVLLAPDDIGTRRLRADVLRASGRRSAAVAEFRDIAEATGSATDAGRLFDVLFEEGLYRKAISAASRLRRPSSRQRRNLALARAWSDDCAEAIEPLRALSPARQADTEVWRARRDCAIALGDLDDALLASEHLRAHKRARQRP